MSSAALQLLVSLISAVEISPAEFEAAYRQNALAARTLQVQWTTSKTPTEGRQEYLQVVATHLAEQRKATPKGEPEAKGKRDLAEFYERMAKQATKADAQFLQMDYWSDRTNFQIRFNRDKRRGGPISLGNLNRIHFPVGELSSRRLGTEFKDVLIVSFGPETTGSTFRIWQASQRKDGHFAAIVGPDNRLLEDSVLPPLALPDDSWQSVPHPVDEFYEMVRKGEARVLAEVTTDGRPTHLITVDAVSKEGRRYGARGFVDLARGGLPVRLEFFGGPLGNFYDDFHAICESHPQLIAHRIVKDWDVREIERNGVRVFYPMAGQTWVVSAASGPGRAISPAQPQAAVHEVGVWTVDQINFNEPMSAANFVLAFPPKTIFIDTATNEVLVSGDVEGHAQRMVQQAIAYQPSRSRRWIYWSAGLLVVMGVIGIWVVRRRKA